MPENPQIPERIPQAVMLEFEKHIREKNTKEFEAIAQSLRDFLVSDEISPELKAVAARWSFKIVPKIMVYLPK